MGNQRAQRVGEQMKEEIAQLIRDLKDPRIGFASVVQVDVSGDLSTSKVYISVLGNDEEKKNTIKGLQSATGFIRSELARRLQIRHTPGLQFVLDTSIEHGARIAELLHKVNKQEDER